MSTSRNHREQVTDLYLRNFFPAWGRRREVAADAGNLRPRSRQLLETRFGWRRGTPGGGGLDDGDLARPGGEWDRVPPLPQSSRAS